MRDEVAITRTEGVAVHGAKVVLVVEEVTQMEKALEWVADVEKTPIKTKCKKRAVGMPEQVVDKRLRLLSQYVVSPFMAEVKTRTFVDGMYPNLFQDVDPAKWKTFETE